MRLNSQSQSRLKILTVLQTVQEVALISNVVSTGKSMHKGFMWFTQNDKEILSSLENSSVTVSRKAYHRERKNISSAMTFCRLLAAPVVSEKITLTSKSNVYIAYILPTSRQA